VITGDQRGSVRRIAAARMISLAGSGAAFAALAYIVYHLTGESTAWASYVLLCTIGAQGLFVSIASGLGDRFDRRRVLVIADLAAALSFVALALMRTPGQYLLVAFITAVVESPIYAVSAAVIPNLVEEEGISWANSVVAFGRNVGNLIGPALGGLLVAIFAPGVTTDPDALHSAGTWVFLLNAVTFVFSAWLVGSTPGRFSDRRPDGSQSEHVGVVAGVRFMLREPVLRTIAIAWAVLLLGLGMTIVAEPALADVFESGSIGYGLLASAWGAGSVIGAVAAQRLLRASNEFAWLIVAVLIGGLGFGSTSVAPVLGLALLFMVVGGIGEGVGGVAEQGIFQRRTPDEVRSRVLGALEATILLSLAASFVLGGPVVGAIGARWTYAIGGVSFLFAAAILAPIYVRDRARTVSPA
jgi:MFS family permease